MTRRFWQDLIFLVLSIFFSALPRAQAQASPLNDSTTIDPQSLTFLQDLVAIASGTSLLDGQRAMRERIEKEFKNLGLKRQEFIAESGRKVLTYEFEGAPIKVLLLAHTDTVFNNATQAGILRAEGNKLFGPGVIDMKGGIVLIHRILKELHASGGSTALKGLRVIFNDDEETGSKASEPILRQLAQGAQAALIFEPGLADGSLVTAHAGLRWLKLSVKGRAAHAGLEPEKGLNACVELGFKLSKIGQLSDSKRRLSVSTGMIEGGTSTNTVCEQASARLDVRYFNKSDLDTALTRLGKITKQMHVRNDLLNSEPSAELETLVSIEPMPAAQTAELFKVARQVGANLGQKLRGQGVGYVSDGNNLASSGIQLLVGLGPYGGGMHSSGEFMDTASFRPRVELGKALIQELLRR